MKRNRNFVITIARGFGSGGKDIGMRLGKALGIPCYERQLLTMASDASGIDEDIFVEQDERLRGVQIINYLNKFPETRILEPHERGFASDDNVFNIMAELIRSIAKHQSCIIVGKCADVVLQDYSNVVRLYIEAPRSACVESIMKRMNVSERRANQLIRTTDRYRAKYYNYYSGGRDWTNPTNYDMVLNSDRIGREHCVELIISYLSIRFGMSVEELKACAHQ